MSSDAEPRADRPYMSGYFVGAKTLPWAWARTRLEASPNYWVATVTPDGRPHCRPVWGVWIDGALYFSTGSRIGVNIAQNPRVSVNVESGDEVVIVEGIAEMERDAAKSAKVIAEYNEKYSWEMTGEEGGGFYRVRPTVAFAWQSDGSGLDGGAAFSATVTRFTFG
jgi:nitroimidazol reductase NimA-like FMN-containing flavoprotein (pyridoxamine 5'-phosphate oxidase superfamily)